MKKYILLALLLILAHAGYCQEPKPRIDSVLSDKVAMVNGIREHAGTLGTLIKGMKKAKDTVYILVTNVSVAEPNLSLLKNAISKGKNNNIRSLYQEGTVILKVIGKNNAGVIYDELDASLKKMFDVSDIGDSQMILVYKAPPTK